MDIGIALLVSKAHCFELGNLKVCGGKGMECIDSIKNLTILDLCAPSCNDVDYQTVISSAKIENSNYMFEIDMVDATYTNTRFPIAYYT